jgi:hypothetical protein
MKSILIALLWLPTICIGQSLVKIQISYQTSSSNQNTVHIDSILVESGFGQGGALKFHLLIFDNVCELVDSLELGEYNPFNSNYKAYHYRQIETYDMAQFDSTLKYRIPDGFHYFIYTPCQYRKDFVSTAYSPVLQTLDSLWGPQVPNATTAMIAYGIKGIPSSYESIIVDPLNVLTSMTKTICFDAGIEEFQMGSSFEPIVYPNPTSNSFNIQFFDEGKRIVQIFDLTGKLLSELKVRNEVVEMNINDFDPGHYLLRILDERGTFVKQLILE